jgi:hypothetical protein
LSRPIRSDGPGIAFFFASDTVTLSCGILT